MINVDINAILQIIKKVFSKVNVILIRMADVNNQIGDKICFASSNKTLNRVYRESPDIEITSDEKAQDQQNSIRS